MGVRATPGKEGKAQGYCCDVWLGMVDRIRWPVDHRFMAEILVRCRDFLDGTPVKDAEISVTLVRTTKFTSPPPEPRVPGDPAGIRVRDVRPVHEVSGPTPVSGPLTLTTDQGGDALFAFDPAIIDNALRGNVSSDFAPVTKVWVHLRVVCETIEHVFTDRAEITNGGQNVEIALNFDFAIVCVGHVTDATARLWFALTGDPVTGASYSVRVFDTIFPRPRVRTPVCELAAVLNGPTGVVEATGLVPGSAYRFEVLRTATATQAERRLATGSFTTRPAQAPTQIRLAFGSCVGLRTLDSSPKAILPTLAQQSRDALLLLGDQLYAGPVGGGRLTAASVGRQFDRMYSRQWAQPYFRECLRRGATYMMLDDHDVADDWGTAFTSASRPALVAGAMEAYQRWQHAHNPSTPTGRYHYTLRFGPVAVFVMDQRTNRGVSSDLSHFVLGAAQADDLIKWLDGDAATADVAVVVSPVPMAFFPANTVNQLVRELTDAVRRGAQVSGAILGGLVGGLAGAGAGWYLGGELFDLALDEAAGNRLAGDRIVEPDVADQWVTEENRVELHFVLKHLFDYANDVSGGGRRRHEVVILSGDAHVGMVHEIRSDDPVHAAHPVIRQFTASPLNRGIDPMWAEPVVQRLISEAVEGLDFPPPFRARFVSEPRLLTERNFGMLTITRSDPRRRVYRVQAQIRGTEHNLSANWTAVLDSLALPGT